MQNVQNSQTHADHFGTLCIKALGKLALLHDISSFNFRFEKYFE